MPEQKNTVEPMLKFNGSGYGIKWATVLQMIVVLVGGVAAFVMVQAKLDNLAIKVTENRAAVELSIQTLAKVVETARQERTQDIKELERRVAGGEAERARLTQQVSSLEKLIEDVRDLLRKQANRPG